MTYKEYWGYYWRVINRHRIPGIFQWDRELVDLIQEVCKLAPGAKILDLGCGGGDQAKVFAQKGFKVTGIDNVPSLITFARDAFRKEGLSGEFIEQDMRAIKYESRFDLVTMLSGTFGFFNESENLEILEKIYRALKSGGAAFLDYLPLERFSRVEHRRTWDQIENGYSLAEEWFDAPTATYRTRHLHILYDGRIIEGADEEGYGANEVIRCYSAREIELLAGSVGFKITAHLTRNHVGNPGYQAKDDEPRGMLVLLKGGGDGV
jgi:ubiquinone/menaquinone biosynthesis C-methylase UbiE